MRARRTMVGAVFFFLAVVATTTLVCCEDGGKDGDGGSVTETPSALAFDTGGWSHDADHDVYWKVGVGYCAKPASTEHETMAIYVPGAYMACAADDDGTYTCTPDGEGAVGGYTAATAPVVFPVETPGYSAHVAPTSYGYSGAASYLAAGFVYVDAGMRGRANGYASDGSLAYSGGAPWGVTDLKAAVRYYRYNTGVLPGDPARVFTFGMSGGGAQSSLMGATGDSELYRPYLEAIGAAMEDADGKALSDAVLGAMAWCPITSLDFADAAYEWNLGQFAASGTRAVDTWTSALSADLAASFATHVNALGLVDEDGTALLLEASPEGIFAAGTYYEYLRGVIERSLNDFLADTTFPYTPSSGMGPGGGGFPPGGALPSGERPSGGGLPEGAGSASATTYETVEDYLDDLDAERAWIAYDAASNTATVASVAGFVQSCKPPTKDVGAFDALDRSAAENDVFGTDESDALHFDASLESLLATNAGGYAAFADWDAAIPEAYTGDLASEDALGVGSAVRQNMYNPMYYVSSAYEGYGTSTVAPHWRIRTGIEQGDTALTVEVNLALALRANDGVESVDFATVWGQGHTQAERTGSAAENFIAWVTQIAAP